MSSASSSSNAATTPVPLTDTLGRFHNYLRISLTERCNLRCRYCMPAAGVPNLTPDSKLLSTDEILRLVRLFVSLGVNKVRLTGGEPLLHRDIVPICASIREAGVQTIGMTTNGILLHRHLLALHGAGLTNINISLDTLHEDRFDFITRRKGFTRVMDSLRLAESLPFQAVKVNCVVMRGVNDAEVGEFAMMAKDRKIEVRFIEYMPFDDNSWSRDKMVPFMETMDRIEDRIRMDIGGGGGDATPAAEPKENAKRRIGGGSSSNILIAVPPKGGDTAKVFRAPGHRGTIGFITSMTTQFCGTCNRIRLTADGHLKVCLFDGNEVSLRDPIRAGASDAELTEIISAAIKKKHPSLGGNASPEAIAASVNREMVRIGG